MKIRAVIAALSVGLLSGCGVAAAAAAAPSAPHQPSPTTTASPAAGTCHLGSRDGQPLPDPTCTPGVVNPSVTQATIGDTICKSGWTATVRPPVTVTNRIKQQTLVAYGLPADTQGELDHLVSLELGGAPQDTRNLWVEPGKVPNPKDAVEGQLNKAVCSGLVPLTVAQQAIAADWVTAFDVSGLRVSGGKVCLRADPTRCVQGR